MDKEEKTTAYIMTPNGPQEIGDRKTSLETLARLHELLYCLVHIAKKHGALPDAEYMAPQTLYSMCINIAMGLPLSNSPSFEELTQIERNSSI